MEDHSIDYYQELLFSIGEELSNLPSSLPTPSPSSSTGSSAQHPRVQRAKTTLPAPFPRYAWECSRDEPPGGSFGSSPGRMSTRSRTRFKSPLTPMSSRTIDSPISTPSVDIADGSTASIHSQKGVIETPLEFRDELKVQVPDLVDDKAHLDSPATASTSAAHDENCLSDAPDDTDIINCLTDFELEREQRGSRLTDCVIPLVLADDTITSLKIVDLTEENNPVRRCLRMNRQKANVLEHARQTAEEELADICKQTKANDEEQAEAFPSHFVRVARNVLRRTFRRNAEEKRMFGRSLVSTKLASKFNSELPLFVHYIMSILLYAAEKCQIHGLFRTAAVASEALECREQCNRLGVNDPLPEAYCREAAIPVLADVFKKFLREIPNKLISSHVCSMMSACMSLEDYESRLHALRCCVLLMDKCQRNALFVALLFFRLLGV
ncbi:hypothetical protein M3Y99_00337800 [Aphelenchoides fujianensis]|nr:hypothetical protein M3Y99_00337800 [Aphelenchoides fujianensis]